jgi:hypothetical protein
VLNMKAPTIINNNFFIILRFKNLSLQNYETYLKWQ